MATFDPYHKWLGIPPADQPPNHYRLLGLNLFESDADVIDVATEQRVAYLRGCATGEHIAESQKLLNEVAAARLCLLNAEKKEEYDKRLRKSLVRTSSDVDSAVPEATPLAMPWEDQSGESLDATKASESHLTSRQRQPFRRVASRSSRVERSKVLGIAAVLFVITVGFVLMKGKGDPDKIAFDPGQASSQNEEPMPGTDSVINENKRRQAAVASDSSVAKTANSPGSRSGASTHGESNDFTTKLLNLEELNGEVVDAAPFVTADGLEIYWHLHPTSGTKVGMQIYSARRKSPGVLFADKKRLFAGHSPVLSADGLRMLFQSTDSEAMKWTSRRSRDQEFGPPETHPTLAFPGLDPAPRWLSEDELTLYLDLQSKEDNNRFHTFEVHRDNVNATWKKPSRVAANFPGMPKDFRFVQVSGSADNLHLYCTAEFSPTEPRIGILSRTETRGPFTEWREIPLTGSNGSLVVCLKPQFVAQTKELYLASPFLFSDQDLAAKRKCDLWVIKNFQPPVVAASGKATAGVPAIAVARPDSDRLQGRWECVFEESVGAENTAAELAGMKKVMTVSGTQFIVQRVINGVAGEYRGTFSLGWDGERRLFDFSGTGPNGKQVEWMGLYEFDGGVFKVCYRTRLENDPSRERADTFGTWANSSRVFNKFRRISEPAETRKVLAISDVPRPMTTGFESRGTGSRQAMLASGGGTAESERAVAAALDWIARHQSPDGSWNCKQFSNQCNDPSCRKHVEKDAKEYSMGATSFGLLPMFAAGLTAESDSPYQSHIRRGLDWMLKNQDSMTGRLGTESMYEHGLATITLCEAYGLSKDPKLRGPAQAAVNYIQDIQHSGGGWRYKPNQPGDTSVVGWMVMALRSAQLAGLQVKSPTLDTAQGFLQTVARGKSGGLAAYDTSAAPTPSMTAIGLLCRQYDGAKRSDSAMIEGINYLLANPPHALKDCYYWYYATQVMHNLSGSEWQEWNNRARELWIATQIKEGCAAGSWSPEGHGNATAGPLMVTSLCALNLEVYYRSRPLYQVADRERDDENPKTGDPEKGKPTETKKPDPATLVKTKLDKAKSEYESDLKKVRTKMLTALERKESDARKDGNKTLVEQIEVERTTLDELQLLPQSIPTREFEVGIGKARNEMKMAYETAIKDYTRNRLDIQAGDVTREQTVFLAEEFNFQGRWRVRHSNGWSGERVVKRDMVLDDPKVPKLQIHWKRTGTTIRVTWSNGGAEQLTIDPKKPNHLEGVRGVQWDRIIPTQKKK